MSVVKLPLDVPVQALTLWCWAACAVGVADYFGVHSWTQCQVASAVTGRSCCPSGSGCNSREKLSDALHQVDHLLKLENRRLSFDEIRSEIDAGLPVAIRILWSADRRGHFLVIHGYTE